MTFTLLTSVTGAGDAVSLAVGQDALLPASETLISTTASGIQGPGSGGTDLKIFGDIYADDDGLRITATTWLMVGSESTIHGGSRGINVNGADSTVQIAGEVSGALGLATQGDRVQATITGSISGTANGVQMSGEGSRLVNLGEIVQASQDTSSEAVELFQNGSGAVTVFVNHGLVSGQFYAYHGDFNFDDVMRNFGTMLGLVNSDGGDDVVRNGGLIGGDVTMGDGFDLLRNNAGEIQGDVDMGDAADKVLNRDGVIYGDLDLGAGNDLYRGGKGSVVEGRIIAGDENDTVVGGDGEDTVEGGGGFDLIKGKGGDDVLKGGAGLDIIVGGTGDDEMTGGSLSDVFRIGKHSGDDVITDFQNEVDVIDLTRLSITGAGKVAQVQAAAHDVAGGSIIDLDALGGDGSLELQGLFVAQYGGAEFIF